MFSKFILTVAIALHRAATKVRISAHVLTADVANYELYKSAERVLKAHAALVAMRDAYRDAEIAAEAQAQTSDAVRAENFRAIEMLENPAL